MSPLTIAVAAILLAIVVLVIVAGAVRQYRLRADMDAIDGERADG